jgi:XamI restriction endonuclease
MHGLHDFAYSQDELRADIARARELFVERVLYKVPAAYNPKVAAARHEVELALQLTSDLTALDPAVIVAHPEIVAALRYVAAPPISEEDFRTVTGWPFKPSPNSRSVQASAPAVCRAVAQLVDPLRFPWVREGRRPRGGEREAALNATATVLAVERFRTERRGSASKEQEAAVREVLTRDAGLRQVDPPARRGRGNINMIDDLERGTFTTECVLYGDKCDVPVRLPDGLLMPIECKVSNGQKNGWKRVRREVEGKAGRWRQRFGDAGVVVGVMLDGNFDLGVLREFQEEGCFIFWQHDLQRLVDFVDAHNP